jgi:hypothetical protein
MKNKNISYDIRKDDPKNIRIIAILYGLYSLSLLDWAENAYSNF